jgi:hypothetical protein
MRKKNMKEKLQDLFNNSFSENNLNKSNYNIQTENNYINKHIIKSSSSPKYQILNTNSSNYDFNTISNMRHSKSKNKIVDMLNKSFGELGIQVPKKKSNSKNKNIFDNINMEINVNNNKKNILNNNKSNLCYTKKRISLEKDRLYPFKERKITKNDQKYLSSNNLINNANVNNTIQKISIRTNLINDNDKNNKKVPINNEEVKVNDILFEDKTSIEIQHDKNNENNENNKNNYSCLLPRYNRSSSFNSLKDDIERQKNEKIHEFKTIENKLFFDKENKSIISNYNDKKKKKDNIMNIYSYNYNYNSNNSRNILNNNYLYKKTIELKEKDFNKNMLFNNDLRNRNNCKTLQIINDIESKNTSDLNTINHRKQSNKIDNNFNLDYPYIELNNISQKLRTDNLYKKHENKNKNNYFITNTQRINSFREKLLSVKDKNSSIKTKFNTTKNIINNNKKTDLELILNSLNVSNFQEAKNKIKQLIIIKKFYQKIGKLYNESNSFTNNYNVNDILSWIYDISKYSNHFNYKFFLEDIMKEHKIKDFEELKMIVNNYINKD